MNAVGALFYGDRRRLGNELRRIRNDPRRLLLWSAYALFLVFFGWMRVRGGHVHDLASAAIERGFGDLMLCLILGAMGAVLIGALRSVAGAFSSRTEALLFARATLPPAWIAAYLQARNVAVILARSLTRSAYAVVLIIPRGTAAAALVAYVAVLLCAAVAVLSLVLPVALARGGWLVAARVAGGCFIALGVLVAVGDLAPALGTATPLPAWHLAGLIAALTHGALWILLVPLAVAAVTSALFARAVRDAIPELYTLSIERLDGLAQRSTRRELPLQARIPRGRTATSSTAPGWAQGTLAFVWLDARAWRRVGPANLALTCGLVLVVGAGLGAVARQPDAVLLMTSAITLAMLWLLLGSFGGMRLTREMRRPLFWLGDASLTMRLAAWAFAGLWRDAIVLAVGALGFAVVASHPRQTLDGLVAGLGLAILSRAIGLVVFAILPGTIVQTGPAALLRTALVLLFILPPLFAALIVGFLTVSALAGTVAALLIALGEAVLLTTLAAWRLAGRVDILAG
ncbi:MAG: hypothetical protein ABSD03_06500 [Vulcanimicrobiaceae bacterium]